MTDLVEDFYGVYLLYNVGDRFKGRTYIGFTVNPNRRISQHNQGIRSGGAKKTSSKGPWLVNIVIKQLNRPFSEVICPRLLEIL